MKLISIIILLFALSSCARLHVTVIDKDNPDQPTCEASSITLFKDFGKPDFEGCGMHIGATSSKVTEVDMQWIASIAKAAELYFKLQGVPTP
jgi:hypothetical protein